MLFIECRDDEGNASEFLWLWRRRGDYWITDARSGGDFHLSTSL
jgi:hypothetical protein